jgi:hypothetical protein
LTKTLHRPSRGVLTVVLVLAFAFSSFVGVQWATSGPPSTGGSIPPNHQTGLRSDSCTPSEQASASATEGYPVLSTTAGDTIVAEIFVSDSSQTVTSVTGTASGDSSFTRQVQYVEPTYSQDIELWTATAGSTGSDTIDFDTTVGLSFASIIVFDVSCGVWVAGSSGAESTTSNPMSLSVDFTALVSTDLIIGVFGENSGTDATPSFSNSLSYSQVTETGDDCPGPRPCSAMDSPYGAAGSTSPQVMTVTDSANTAGSFYMIGLYAEFGSPSLCAPAVTATAVAAQNSSTASATLVLSLSTIKNSTLVVWVTEQTGSGYNVTSITDTDSDGWSYYWGTGDGASNVEVAWTSYALATGTDTITVTLSHTSLYTDAVALNAYCAHPVGHSANSFDSSGTHDDINSTFTAQSASDLIMSGFAYGPNNIGSPPGVTNSLSYTMRSAVSSNMPCGDASGWFCSAETVGTGIAGTTSPQNIEWTQSTTDAYTLMAFELDLATGNQTLTVPDAPTSLTIVSTTGTTVSLSWTQSASGGIVNNTLYFTTGATCTGLTPINLGGPATSYTLTGLALSTQFSFTVTAWNAAYQSAQSNCATGTTLDPPDAPTDFSTGPFCGYHKFPDDYCAPYSSDYANFTWTPPPGTVVNYTLVGWFGNAVACTGTHYSLSLSAHGWSSPQGYFDAYPSIFGPSEWGDKRVCFGLFAWNSTGEGPGAFQNITFPPDPPAWVSYTPGSGKAVLKWTLPADETVDNVTLFYNNSAVGKGCDSGAVGLSNYSKISAGLVSGYTVTGLTNGDNYCFDLVSNNGTAYGDWFPAGEVYVTPGSNPVVTGLTVTTPHTSLGLSELVVTWTNPTGVTMANDTIYIQTSFATTCGGLRGTSLGIVVTHTYTGLTAGTTYCIAVQAWSNEGSSALVFANGTTLPNAVTNLTAEVGITSILWAWDNPVGSYQNISITVARSCGAATSQSLGKVTSYSSTGLMILTTYCAVVTAWNAVGVPSLLSNVSLNASTDLPLSAPTGVVVTSFGSTSINIKWTNPTGPTLTNDTVWVGVNGCSRATPQSTHVATENWTLNGLSASTTYCIEVQAWDGGYSSPLSSSISQTTSTSGGGGGGGPCILPSCSPSQVTHLITTIPLLDLVFIGALFGGGVLVIVLWPKGKK